MSALRDRLRGIVVVASALTTVTALAQHAPDRAAVASAHPLASEAGIEVLAAGGNAFDAAIAVSASLSVVEPFGSGIGGGALFLLQPAGDGQAVMVDARDPLEVSKQAAAVEWAGYVDSWKSP